MRNELELMDTINKYIQNEMSAEERKNFEAELNANAQLKAEVKLQTQIMQGIKRHQLKQSTQNAFKAYKSKLLFTKIIIAFVISLAITAASFFAFKQLNKTKALQNELPNLNEAGTAIWSDADKYLPTQTFVINNSLDTVIETEVGMVVCLPANSFLSNTGKPINGNIEVEIKEALTADAIIQAGLSTTANGNLLETGGMFYVNAKQDDEQLKINTKEKGIRIDVPTKQIVSGMQLFEGERKTDGTINWVNPKPIEKDLIPVDINTLNFYPPGYLDTLAKWGFNANDKKFTDSLYYSFAQYFEDNRMDTISKSTANNISNLVFAEKITSWEEFYNYTFELTQGTTKNLDYWNENHFYKPAYQVNPLQIAGFWNNEFNNTLIATKEFEERLQVLHEIGAGKEINIYLNNLDKKMCTIDSMIAFATNDDYTYKYASRDYAEWKQIVFADFAKRGDGRVKINNNKIKLLKKFYTDKQNKIKQAIADANQAFWKNNNIKDANKFNEKERERIEKQFEEEVQLNLNTVYEKLGQTPPKIMQQNTYSVTIENTGWHNIDKYIIENTMVRETNTYTDENGNSAKIEYEEIITIVENQSQFDRTQVYYLPQQLNSFIRANEKNKMHSEKLNQDFDYNLLCVAYKNEDVYCYLKKNIKEKNHKVNLVKVSKNSLNNLINEISKGNQATDLISEQEFQKNAISLMKLNKAANDKIGLKLRIASTFFPSWDVIAATNDKDIIATAGY